MISNMEQSNIMARSPASSSQYRYKRQKRIPVFPQRLYDMLEHAEEGGYDHIFSWMPGGKSFKIHPTGARDDTTEKAIVDVLKKNNFQQTKVRSFLRQLNQYGFERTHKGPNKGECKHEFFVRGRRDMLEDKSIDDFQRQNCDEDEDEDEADHAQERSFHRLLRLSTRDHNSLFLDQDTTNYWKPSSANLTPNGSNRPPQGTSWQKYGKPHMIPSSTCIIKNHCCAGDEQQQHIIEFKNGLVLSNLTPRIRDDQDNCQADAAWNDDDTIPTIDSTDDNDFDDFVESEVKVLCEAASRSMLHQPMKFEHNTKFPKRVRSNSFATQVSLEYM